VRISAFESPELQATILAINGMDLELKTQIRKATRSITEPEWTRELNAHASTLMETRVLSQTARVTVSNQNITLKTGQLSRRMTGGSPLASLTPAVEFGANRNKVTKGRHTARQFKKRNRKGYVAMPAAADIIPRIASLWVQTVVRTFHEALDKGVS